MPVVIDVVDNIIIPPHNNARRRRHAQGYYCYFYCCDLSKLSFHARAARPARTTLAAAVSILYGLFPSYAVERVHAHGSDDRRCRLWYCTRALVVVVGMSDGGWMGTSHFTTDDCRFGAKHRMRVNARISIGAMKSDIRVHRMLVWQMYTTYVYMCTFWRPPGSTIILRRHCAFGHLAGIRVVHKLLLLSDLRITRRNTARGFRNMSCNYF